MAFHKAFLLSLQYVSVACLCLWNFATFFLYFQFCDNLLCFFDVPGTVAGISFWTAF